MVPARNANPVRKKQKKKSARSEWSRSGTFSWHGYRHAEGGARVRHERIHVRHVTHTHNTRTNIPGLAGVSLSISQSRQREQGTTTTQRSTRTCEKRDEVRSTFRARGAGKVPAMWLMSSHISLAGRWRCRHVTSKSGRNRRNKKFTVPQNRSW